MVNSCMPIGGTYIPEKNETANIINVLRVHFFDSVADIETDEEVDILPTDAPEGAVY